MIVLVIWPPAKRSGRLSEPIKYWIKKKKKIDIYIKRRDCIIAHHAISTGLRDIIAFPPAPECRAA